MKSELVLTSTITCPQCSYKKKEQMAENSCQWFYGCEACGDLIKPKKGDCCVFCSYGTNPCPPVQAGGGCCE